MNREQFKKNNLELLVSKEKDIARYFKDATDDDRRRLETYLDDALDHAYSKYAEEYFKTQGIGRYATNLLRLGSSALKGLGTYMFWALPGAPGVVSKTFGTAGTSLADLIDSYHFHKHTPQGMASKSGATLTAKNLLWQLFSYAPTGVEFKEIADVFRGKNRFDTEVVKSALYDAKNEFLKKVGTYKAVDEPKIISLDSFRNPAYASEMRKAA